MFRTVKHGCCFLSTCLEEPHPACNLPIKVKILTEVSASILLHIYYVAMPTLATSLTYMFTTYVPLTSQIEDPDL